MKRRDVFIQILHEVSGEPEDFINGLLNAFLATSDAEYESLLNGMRKEKEGIKAWLMKGNLDFVLRHGDPFGEA